MRRGRYDTRSADDMYGDFLDACRITHNLLCRRDLTHHPYDTLLEIAETFRTQSRQLNNDRRRRLNNELDKIGSLAKMRIGSLAAGYQGRHAQRSLERFLQVRPVDDQ